MSRAKRTGGLVAAGFLLIGMTALAAPGDLDPSFSDDGKQITDIEGGPDRGFGLAPQANGRIVVVGDSRSESGTEGNKFLTLRYQSNGALDEDFSDDGFDTKQIGDPISPASSATAAVLQPGGKIVVAGQAFNAQGNNDFAVIRYLANGTMDTSFGDNGIRLVDFNGGGDRPVGMALQSTGKIVIAGNTGDGDDIGNFAVARLTPDGTLDKSFTGDGTTTIDFPSSSTFDMAAALAVDSDDKIVMVGHVDVPPPASANDGPLGSAIRQSAVARLNPDGSPDSSFGDGGRVVLIVSETEEDEAYAVTVDHSGRILVSGRVDFAGYIARLRNDGVLHSSFGINGVMMLPTQEGTRGLAMQVDGKIIAAGNVFPDNLVVSRLKPDGSIDSSFGSAGHATVTQIAFATNIDLRIDKANKIVVAATATSGASDVAVIRFLSGLPPNCSLAGDASGNVLVGGAGRDYICGLAGKDRLNGKAGKDTLVGGPGADVLIGGPGDDTCLGGPGKDETINC